MQDIPILQKKYTSFIYFLYFLYS